MSWATCYQGCNSTYFNYPALMSDGRIWATWQPEAVTNQNIQTQHNLTTNWAYRQYLQHNGDKIASHDTQLACSALGLPVHFSSTTNNPSNNVPFTFRGTFDTATPGFGYCSSDLKNPYLTREQLAMRTVAPNINLNR